MNGSSRVIVRMFGFDPDAQTDAMSEEEIKIIINNSYNGCLLYTSPSPRD